MSENLEFTGERFTPECTREIRYEHYHRYAVAAEWVKGRKVLDAACGEGYGSHWLAQRADSVTGIDVSAEAIAHANERYGSEKLEFIQADCCSTAFEDHSFDCIVSFETLEHLEDHDGLVREFRRILRPDGFLLISSPDKAVYSDQQGNDNPYHVRELYRPEFEQLLASRFPAVSLLGQKLGFHSMIWPLQAEQAAGIAAVQLHQEKGQELLQMQQPAGEPVYLLAMCASSPEHLPATRHTLSLFDDDTESVYKHYYHEIRHNLAAGEVLGDLRSRVRQLEAELELARESAGGSAVQNVSPEPGGWFARVLSRFRNRPD